MWSQTVSINSFSSLFFFFLLLLPLFPFAFVFLFGGVGNVSLSAARANMRAQICGFGGIIFFIFFGFFCLGHMGELGAGCTFVRPGPRDPKWDL